ncbi:kinesin-domain-containing protein [Fistulina hepatica ATCC 64428]|uniref:Kinesin-domain-containing protein n=1 Tax=Fistulina hepatica ATCC 64428 TaxID=1128425 RepID=A0A0D7A5A8_9AGAR|nr:kinesin-domain-containing protein [Fistulina hepatica ATCC 64428]
MVAAGSITVAVRKRPPTAWEAVRLPEVSFDTTIRGDGALSTPGRSVTSTSPLRDIVQIVDDRILTFDPAETDPSRAFLERGFLPPGTKRYKDKRFMFDKVFDNDACQQDVYDATARPLLDNLLDGYNATVFAYGATGCGKTHTISGTEEDPGIIYLTMADLFQRIEDRKADWEVDVMVTFLEIYNEEIRDLLCEIPSQQRGGLCIREDKTVKVVGLTELKPKTAEEVKQIVLQGNSCRTQSPTHANETSSRSHAVLQVHVTQSPRTAALTEQKTLATLSIIDLAGSERAAATTNMGQRMVEGANINKSLLALGNCINALCESGGAVRHIPYRNSKLTRLLKFSLGGNCKTVMIVCIAPTSNHFDDTHNTLVYAERATKIKTRVVTRNVVNVNRHVGQYVEAINKLNIEIAELKAKLVGKNAAEAEIARRKKAEAAAEVEREKKDIVARKEQTQTSIVDGALCAGKIAVAETKLAAIRTRLSEIDQQASNGPLPVELETERGLLQALARPEEDATKSTSSLHTRLQRSQNSSAMFEAAMRAVSERKSNRLDEISVENVRLAAQANKAEIERLKAEEERNAMKHGVEDMAQVLVNLVGMLGRGTVKVGEMASLLKEENGKPGGNIGDVTREVSSALEALREKNDDAFTQLVGHSTAEYTVDDRSFEITQLDNFKGFGTFNRRASSASTGNIARRSLAGHRQPALGSSADEPRRNHRTPRKSLRSSIASLPYRRVSDKERRVVKHSKNVQWKDEAGQGKLDDSIPQLSFDDSTFTLSQGNSSLPRAPSVCGSESEWEDDSTGVSSSSFLAPIREPAARTVRPRPNRLDPSFLKSKTRSALGSLAEDDEEQAEDAAGRRVNPLADRSINQLNRVESISACRAATSRNATAGKTRERSRESRGLATPAKRVPATPRSMIKGGSRRRSNIGPLRSEKNRRRSSMIPQLDRRESAISAQRAVSSPAKRSKRSSISSRALGISSLRLRSLPSSEGNSSIDTSLRNGAKPTWK